MSTQLAQLLAQAMPGANGATPPTWEGPGYNQMMGGLRQADQDEALAMALLGKNNQTGGWGGVASALIGGLMGSKKLKSANALRKDTMGKLDGYEANQAMRKQFQEHQKSLREKKAAEAEYQRTRSDKAEDRQAQLENQKALAQFNAGLRPQAEKAPPGVDQQMWSMLSPEQQAAAAQAKFSQQQGKQDDLDIAVQRGVISPEEADARRRQEALGVGDNKEANKQQNAMQDIMGSLANLKGMVQENGTEFMGADSKRMSTAYTDVIMKAKEAYNLGVLNGGDLEQIQNLINDPTSFGSAINPWAGGNVLAQIEEAEKIFGKAAGGGQQAQGSSIDDLLSKY